MKKKLIKPPEGNREILFLPDAREILYCSSGLQRAGVPHQPYFFNPGVSVKFLFLETLPAQQKSIIFLDTDRVRIEARMPAGEGQTHDVRFISSEEALFEFSCPGRAVFEDFFASCEESLRKALKNDRETALSSFFCFKDICLKNCSKKYLKDVLAESFLQFYGIKRGYSFLSDVISGYEFKEFILKIFHDSKLFQNVFNSALDDYRKEFRFRYKNFPFPRLEDGELPFWIVKKGRRKRCFKKDIDITGLTQNIIFPRAATLTIFLRLYKLDMFIHGVGGGNYEWVQDRVIERFFQIAPPFYAVASGTFLFEGYREREFPYFLFSPEDIKSALRERMEKA